MFSVILETFTDVGGVLFARVLKLKYTNEKPLQCDPQTITSAPFC